MASQKHEVISELTMASQKHKDTIKKLLAYFLAFLNAY